MWPEAAPFPGGSCLGCGSVFAGYFCTVCGIANDDVPPQGYFHCFDCGICRVGSSEDYFHCAECNCCLRIELLEGHTCQPGCLEAACPICMVGPMFDSQTPADKLPCGHMAHLECVCSSSLSLDSICRSCSGTSAHIRELVEVLGPQEAEPDERELVDMLQELEQEGLLTPLLAESRGAMIYTEESASNLTSVTLDSHPRLFRQQLEQAVYRSVLLTAPEIEAKGRAIDAVVQLLLRATSSGALQLAGKPVSIDRIEVAGSVGKSVSVQGQFDIDLVAFVNLPLDSTISIDLYDPDDTQKSWWMQNLQQQVCSFLQQKLSSTPGSFPLRCSAAPRITRVAVTFSLSVPTAGAEHDLEFDLLLAPNLAAGAGAAAAAAASSVASSSNASRAAATPAEAQCAAVLGPVLAAADAATAGRRAGIGSSSPADRLQPSFVRSVWLAESSTQFVKAAAVAAAHKGGLSGRVVTSTIRLVKAWVRKGLQPGQPGFKRPKSFMIELLVLHAAERLAAQLASSSRAVGDEAGGGAGSSSTAVVAMEAAAGQQQQAFGGRYVLDLLLEVLAVARGWAQEWRTAMLSPAGTLREPVLFTQLAGNKYYTRQQALALQQLGLVQEVRSQPLVIHPVDPLTSVFDQEEPISKSLWRELGQAAWALELYLRNGSWGEIMRESSLGDALLV